MFYYYFTVSSPSWNRRGLGFDGKVSGAVYLQVP